MNIYPADIVDTHDDRIALQGLALYLQTRFFPPLPADYAEPALAAIRLLNGGDDAAELVLPADLQPTPRLATRRDDGALVISPANLVDILRLHGQINDPDAPNEADAERVDDAHEKADDRADAAEVDDQRDYLVIGIYVDDEPVVAGVVEGDGGTCDTDDGGDLQRWAHGVRAADPTAAEAVALAELSELNDQEA